MEIFEITGYTSGVNRSGVNFLQPADAFQEIVNGYIFRQVLQSRQGIGYFAPRLADQTRVYGIFEHTLPDATKELLAIDENFLYKYNTTTGVFDQIAFGGSPGGGAYAGFGITSKKFYVSGTSYPTATNGARFVFTLQGGTATPGGSLIFFYDGTFVKDFTDDGAGGGDNPDYTNPPGGALTKATYVLWFNERLNFIVPTIAGIDYTQAVLYSGIRDASGNGDKFNVPGSGMLQADTYENITGASILGQVMALNFYRSNWILEKKKDAFNPYFIKKVPSVLGTDANFSAVSWHDIVKSIGKTGIIATDGVDSLRVDNKIPYFTAQEIDQIDFNLTYGGFDRVNNQFLWSYKQYEADTDTQDRVLVNNYAEDTWSVYDFRVTVFGQTDIGINLNWEHIYEVSGDPSWATWDTTEDLWDEIGLTSAVQKTLAGDDLGYIYALNKDYDDYFTTISAITQATSAVVTVTDPFFKVGDLVVVQSVAGMTEINNYDPDLEVGDEGYQESIANFQPYLVTAVAGSTVTLEVDSTLFTAATPNTGTLSKVISFSAKTIPFNPYRDLGRRCYVSHVEFLIDTNGGNLSVDVYEDEDETPFKQNILLIPNSTTKAREWITMSVDNEANFMTFDLKQVSPSVQLRLTSMRIHCQPGGYTSG